MDFLAETLGHNKGRTTRRNVFINFYYSIFQFREKRITLRIYVSKNTKLYNNDMKLQHSSWQILLQFILKFHIILLKFSIFTNKNSQSYTFFPKLKNTIVKIDIKSFSVQRMAVDFNQYSTIKKFQCRQNRNYYFLIAQN